MLWYNKDGGKYYHAEKECPEINEKYYESMASFKYSQLNEAPFKELLPHAACNAPKRPE